MGISAIAPPLALLGPTLLPRLRSLGFDVRETTSHTLTADGFGDALRIAETESAVAAILPRDDADRPAVTERLVDAAAAADATTSAPLGLLVLPARTAPLPGPVAVVTPAETVSAYELYVGAAIASATDRRVVHLNGRGTPGSAVHSGIAGRVLARSASPQWREFPHARPERSLHTVTSRPGAIVVAVPPGSTAAAQIIVDHPDADVILVIDRAHARHGAAVAQQVASMIELAFSLGASTEPEPTPADVEPEEPKTPEPETPESEAPQEPQAPEDPVPDLPGIRASDVVHMRLTSDALEVTNRTAQHLRLRVSLGSAADPTDVRAVFACDLAPREARTAPTSAVEGLAGIEPPVAVMRHWSHESVEVFEGGRQRVLEFHVTVLDAAGDVRAERAYRPGNGLDFFVTARDLAALLGRSVARSVLPEPAVLEASGAPPKDLLGALASALAVGAGVLDARTR